jgi:hypothetical protein
MAIGQVFGTETPVMSRTLPESRDPFQTESPQTSEYCALHENSTNAFSPICAPAHFFGSGELWAMVHDTMWKRS